MPHFTVDSLLSLQKQKESKEIDLDKLASARKRLHENYQEAQNGRVFLLTVEIFSLVISPVTTHTHCLCHFLVVK